MTAKADGPGCRTIGGVARTSASRPKVSAVRPMSSCQTAPKLRGRRPGLFWLAVPTRRTAVAPYPVHHCKRRVGAIRPRPELARCTKGTNLVKKDGDIRSGLAGD